MATVDMQVGKLLRPQPRTNNYRMLKDAESGRNSQYQMVTPGHIYIQIHLVKGLKKVASINMPHEPWDCSEEAERPMLGG